MKLEDFTIGADPELFVSREGSFVSAHGMVGGTKMNPHIVNKGAVQVDGMALEFNIDPVKDYTSFQENLDEVKGQLLDMVKPFNVDFLNEVSVYFNQDFLLDIPNFNKMLGCEPDFDAWSLGVNPKPDHTEMMRTAGGHVHIGGFPTDEPYHPRHFQKSATLIKLMDEELGVYSLLWDMDDKRRDMYGKAGCFRPKRYGAEYRTLSSKWVFSEKLTKFVFDGSKRAFTRFVEGDHEVNPDIQRIINTSNRNHEFFVDNPLVEQLKVA